MQKMNLLQNSREISNRVEVKQKNYNRISYLPLTTKVFSLLIGCYTQVLGEAFNFLLLFLISYLFIQNLFDLIYEPKVIRGDSNYLLISDNELHPTLALVDVSVPYQLLSEWNQTGDSQHHNKMTMKTQQLLLLKLPF